jgi:nucleoside-diphosphate-sugar epimerase
MRIAILGATSQIAKDLVLSFSAQSDHELVLFARRPAAVQEWLSSAGLPGRHAVADFDAFGANEKFDALLNFVGVGDPAQAAAMGASIFDITLKYDEMALDYLRQHPDCRYIFLSSGAAYGASFDAPVDANTKAMVAINNLQPQDWYGAAKLHAECRHRSLPHLSIIDIRVFNYFSRTQDVSARFFIMDIVRAIRDGTVLKTSGDFMVRDFLHPSDFHRLITCILTGATQNSALDCYTRAPVDKPALLKLMQEKFGLKYEIIRNAGAVMNATGAKPYYYSLSRKAAEFGYHPEYSSPDGIIAESMAILG